jgi:hypothetical protein
MDGKNIYIYILYMKTKIYTFCKIWGFHVGYYEECRPSSGMICCVALVRLLQEKHGVTSQKTAFFIVIAVNTSNPTYKSLTA